MSAVRGDQNSLRIDQLQKEINRCTARIISLEEKLAMNSFLNSDPEFLVNFSPLDLVNMDNELRTRSRIEIGQLSQRVLELKEELQSIFSQYPPLELQFPVNWYQNPRNSTPEPSWINYSQSPSGMQQSSTSSYQRSTNTATKYTNYAGTSGMGSVATGHSGQSSGPSPVGPYPGQLGLGIMSSPVSGQLRTTGHCAYEQSRTMRPYSPVPAQLRYTGPRSPTFGQLRVSKPYSPAAAPGQQSTSQVRKSPAQVIPSSSNTYQTSPSNNQRSVSYSSAWKSPFMQSQYKLDRRYRYGVQVTIPNTKMQEVTPEIKNKRTTNNIMISPTNFPTTSSSAISIPSSATSSPYRTNNTAKSSSASTMAKSPDERGVSNVAQNGQSKTFESMDTELGSQLNLSYNEKPLVQETHPNASQVLQKPINSVTKRPQCTYFNRFGVCERYNKGSCEYVHDRSNIRICSRFILGKSCVGHCTQSHDVGEGRIPACKFHGQNSECKKRGCPFLHKNPSPEKKVSESPAPRKRSRSHNLDSDAVENIPKRVKKVAVTETVSRYFGVQPEENPCVTIVPRPLRADMTSILVVDRENQGIPVSEQVVVTDDLQPTDAEDNLRRERLLSKMTKFRERCKEVKKDAPLPEFWSI